MKAILQGWNVMRIVRLVLAVGILVQGIVASEMVAIILGVVFGGMALANIQCCSAGGCAVNQRSFNNKPKAIEYEEVVANK
jgi:hypothetical protein